MWFVFQYNLSELIQALLQESLFFVFFVEGKKKTLTGLSVPPFDFRSHMTLLTLFPQPSGSRPAE